jgi:hypothetical protein
MDDVEWADFTAAPVVGVGEEPLPAPPLPPLPQECSITMERQAVFTEVRRAMKEVELVEHTVEPARQDAQPALADDDEGGDDDEQEVSGADLKQEASGSSGGGGGAFWY